MFKFQLLSDSNSESGVLFAKQQITSNGFRDYINLEEYGNDLNGIVIVLMCREPEIILKRRIRLVKKEKVLYMDIMLDYNKFITYSNEKRLSEICKILLIELMEILNKYNLKDFKSENLILNLKKWFEDNQLI